MIQRTLLLVFAAAAFAAGPLAGRFGPVIGSGLLVLTGVLLALACSGVPHALAVAAGATGAFAGGMLSSVSPAVAGAALLALCYAERTLRVRTPSARAAHVTTALVAGALAGAMVDRYLGAGLTVAVVVVAVASVLASLPLLVDADDPLAHALDEIASSVSEPASASLREGAELCRTVDGSMLDRASAREARSTWKNLLGLARTRARLERSRKVAGASMGGHGEAVARRIDEKIAQHVRALGRMYTAADEARAAEASLEDRALRSVESTGESLEEMSKAIVEEV
jgi:MFS family permease